MRSLRVVWPCLVSLCLASTALGGCALPADSGQPEVGEDVAVTEQSLISLQGLRHSRRDWEEWLERRKQRQRERWERWLRLICTHRDGSYNCLCDRFYNPDDEGRIPYNDPRLSYDWETQHK